MNKFSEFTHRIAKREGKKKQVSIAQINEIVKLVLNEMYKNPFEAILLLWKYGK